MVVARDLKVLLLRHYFKNFGRINFPAANNSYRAPHFVGAIKAAGLIGLQVGSVCVFEALGMAKKLMNVLSNKLSQSKKIALKSCKHILTFFVFNLHLNQIQIRSDFRYVCGFFLHSSSFK